jgi:hypothetical protein
LHLEKLTIVNFRCFGAHPQTIEFDPVINAFIGANGAGKTAAMQALLRMFGISSEQRRIRRQDFHVPAEEESTPQTRFFSLDVIVSFPELEGEEVEGASSIPEFFNQMAATKEGALKCRFRLDATWTDDGSLDGSIEAKLKAVRTFAETFTDDEWSEVSPSDRGRIQMIYIPALRDPASQVTRFLKGRLWRAVRWSELLKSQVQTAAAEINQTFTQESAIATISSHFTQRWQEVHSGGMDANPILRPVRDKIEDLVRNVEIVFRPTEHGGDREIEDLSDGQRSLFQIAMTAAILDIEEHVWKQQDPAFDHEALPIPELTLMALEEPENNLAPFYLARILEQIKSLTASGRAQAFVSSHSASILSRVDPEQVRFFRMQQKQRTAAVRAISLPDASEVAFKFIREAVRTYPELYFARFVILGEGSSEEVVLPRLAEALNLQLDRSFVAIVPLGGRHVNHLWRLLDQLEIPFATLLDLDLGRHDGGAGRIRTTVNELAKLGKTPSEITDGEHETSKALNDDLKSLDNTPEKLSAWITKLKKQAVFFSAPLDLDMIMLKAYRGAYQQMESGMEGPDLESDPYAAVLKKGGDDASYRNNGYDDLFRWYRYLFLGRGKPSTHIRVLSKMSADDIKTGMPKRLKELLEYAASAIDQTLPIEGKC